MHRLRNLELFRTGAHPGSGPGATREFTRTDLDHMVSSFHELGLSQRVPAHFGHVEAGDPAVGWIDRVWRDGDVLMGDLVDIPPKVYDAIKMGMYKFNSIEILMDASARGKTYPFVIDGLALLGAVRPAVGDLKPLSELLMARRAGLSLRGASPIAFSMNSSTQRGDETDMEPKDLEDLKAKFSALESNVTKLSATNDTLAKDNEALRKQLMDRDVAATKATIEGKRAAIGAKFSAAIEAQAILPAVQTRFDAAFRFKDDQAVAVIDLKEVDSFIEANTDKAAAAKFAAGKRKPATGGEQPAGWDKDGDEPADEAVARMSRATMNASDGKLQYSQANLVVLEANPELAAAYSLLYRDELTRHQTEEA